MNPIKRSDSGSNVLSFKGSSRAKALIGGIYSNNSNISVQNNNKKDLLRGISPSPIVFDGLANDIQTDENSNCTYKDYTNHSDNSNSCDNFALNINNSSNINFNATSRNSVAASFSLGGNHVSRISLFDEVRSSTFHKSSNLKQNKAKPSLNINNPESKEGFRDSALISDNNSHVDFPDSTLYHDNNLQSALGDFGGAENNYHVEDLTSQNEIPNPMSTLSPKLTVTNNHDALNTNLDENAINKNHCFAIEGRVCSLTATLDGAYVIAGFSTGIIKIFSLINKSELDDDDRYGYAIGYIDSSNMGTIHLHVEIGYQWTSCDNLASMDDLASHLFVGARTGSTKILVVDIKSLRQVSKLRGFITSAGGGIRTYVHNDGRCRGFNSMISMTRKDQHSHYRLLCGRGYGSYYIWDVTIYSNDFASSELNDLQEWVCLSTGHVSGTSMIFGHLFNYRDVTDNNLLTSSSSSIDTLAYETALHFMTLGNDKDIRIYHGQITSTVTERSLAYSDGEESMPEGCLLQGNVDFNTMKGITNVHAAANNGTILFAGVDELEYMFDASSKVYASKIVETNYFSLSLTASNNKRGRHLRQIDNVCCSKRGDYALLLCSDNAIVLFSNNDHFGTGICPTKMEHGQQLGYITMLFQIEEKFSVKLGLSVNSSEENSYIDDPHNVMLFISWWSIVSPQSGGVLFVTSLLDKNNKLNIPTIATVAGVGFYTEFSGSNSFDYLQFQRCSYCGTVDANHWQTHSGQNITKRREEINRSVLNIASKRVSMSDINIDRFEVRSVNNQVEKSEGKKKSGNVKDTLNVSIEDYDKNKTNLKRARSTSNQEKDEKVINDNVSKQLTSQLQDRIGFLETELEHSKSEANRIMKKADQRFAEEKKVRREWNAKQNEMELRIQTLESEKCSLINKLSNCEVFQNRLLEACKPLRKIFTEYGNDINDGVLDCQSPNQQTPSKLVKCFCIVCQAHTADTIILNCGHICLCNSHAELMRNTGKLLTCPLCKQPCVNTCKVIIT